MRIAVRSRQFIAGTAGALTVLAGLTTWALWPQPDREPAPRERQYKATTACLLTDDQGLNGELAKAAWAGMQQASLDTRIKVQYLAITGPQTAANGLSYYNTLGVRNCTVIVAAGPVPVAAMHAGYRQFTAVKQVAIGPPAPAESAAPALPAIGSTGSGGPVAGSPHTARVVTVEPTPATAVQRRVQEIVAAAAG